MIRLGCTNKLTQKAFGGDLEFKQKHEDESGVLKTTEYVHSLIQKEIDDGIPGERIVVGGYVIIPAAQEVVHISNPPLRFSQGGAISTFSGLTTRAKLAGILALSSFLLLSRQLPNLVPQPELNKNTPVFMAHGEADPVIPVALAKESHNELTRQGYNATLRLYP